MFSPRSPLSAILLSHLFLTVHTKGVEEVNVEEIEEGEEADDEDEEDMSSLYKTFREIYVFLAHIYPKETGDLLLQGMQVLVCTRNPAT
jgi:hypothetical protein